MPITSIDQDKEALTITIVANYRVSAERLWQAYSDPRQLEQFWGPPGWPSTFYRHDFATGGRSSYELGGPDDRAKAGYWEFVSVDPPHSFTVEDGFALPDGTPDQSMPTARMVFTFSETHLGSRLQTVAYLNSLSEFEELMAMGMLEGTKASMWQIDDVLAGTDPLHV